jgi:integrase/recombinase XerD
MPHPRRALPFDQWPDRDRAAWQNALADSDPLEEAGRGAHWRPKTRHTVMTHYGLWLTELIVAGKLDMTASPAVRATRECLDEYVNEMRARGLASITIAGRIRDVREALRVMESGADLSALDHLWLRLQAAAEPSRLKRLRVVSPVLLLDVAIAEMSRQQKAQSRSRSRWTAGRYRDALIIAILATRPLRLANLTSMELGKHLTKEEDIYWCRFSGAETKEGEPLEFPMPRVLTSWIDHYLSLHRPLLRRGMQSRRLWIATRSTPMVDNTVYCRVTLVTERLVGRPINPHLFRDCVATFIAEEAPEQVQIIARILGHSSLAAGEEHYNQAGMLSAQKRYLKTLAQLRHGYQPVIA